MKYFHLVWSALFRRKTRTILTLVSIIAAFLLFGLLDSVRVAFTAGNNVAGAGRLVVTSKMSMQQALPESLGARIANVQGVSAVAYANWFSGVYQDPKNQVFSFAVSPNYLDVYPELSLPAASHNTRQRRTVSALRCADALFHQRAFVEMQRVRRVLGGLRVVRDHHDGLAVLAVQPLQ